MDKAAKQALLGDILGEGAMPGEPAAPPAAGEPEEMSMEGQEFDEPIPEEKAEMPEWKTNLKSAFDKLWMDLDKSINPQKLLSNFLKEVREIQNAAVGKEPGLAKEKGMEQGGLPPGFGGAMVPGIGAGMQMPNNVI